MRVVIETNVAVSAALLPQSVPRQAFDAASSCGTLLVSAATVAEMDEVLRRPKFDRYLSELRRLEFLAAYVNAAEEVIISEHIVVCHDPKDNKFLELAVSGRASKIISGDPNLLALHPFRRIDIVSPRTFLSFVPPQQE